MKYREEPQDSSKYKKEYLNGLEKLILARQKEYELKCPYSFSHALPARYSVLHLTVFCRAVIVEK